MQEVADLKIGDITVMAHTEEALPTSRRFLFPWMTQEHLTPFMDWIVPHYYDPEADKLLMTIQTLILRVGDTTVLVDTCLGNDKKRGNPAWNMRQGDYLERLRARGIAPQDVDYVLCTHLHTDHVGWNTRLVDGQWVPTFPNARYLCQREELEHWKQTTEPEFAETFQDSVLPVLEAGMLDLADGAMYVTPGVELLPTPGHTPGHCSVRITSGAGEGVITGDMTHHPVQFAMPEWSSQFCVNPEQATATRRAFRERFGEGTARVIGTHFPGPLGGLIIRQGDDWRYEA